MHSVIVTYVLYWQSVAAQRGDVVFFSRFLIQTKYAALKVVGEHVGEEEEVELAWGVLGICECREELVYSG